MYRPQWPQQTQLADPHSTSHVVPDYHAQAVAQAVAGQVHDDIPIAECAHRECLDLQRDRKPLTVNQRAILWKYKDSKKLVMPDGETYQGDYVPKGPERKDLTRRTGLTMSQVRSSSSLQTAATLPGLD